MDVVFATVEEREEGRLVSYLERFAG